jgi:uncharacterized membrane protein YgdD (TMEM256/DUF423 family)
MDRTFFVLGALLGAIGVAAGAFGAHALEQRLAPDRMQLFELAARYQLLHALALLGAAWAVQRWPNGLTSASGWLLVVGTVIFSGTIYALAFGAPRMLGAVTPVGGVALIGGWLLLALGALRG